MRKPRIYFRADGSSTIGLGHVIRSLALAEMLNKDFYCIFLIQQAQRELIPQIKQVCHEIIDLPSTKAYSQEAQNLVNTRLAEGDIIVLDGYGFDTQCQRIYKTGGCKVVCIDDLHTQYFVADVVINHAPGVDPSQYNTEAYTQLCLGLSFSLLRPAFLDMAQKKRHITHLDTLFICFGGADPFNLSHKTLSILQSSGKTFKAIHVVVGSANPHKHTLGQTQWDKSMGRLSIHENLSALEMSRLMEQSHIALVPASSLLLEVLAIRMPVISGFYVDNQKELYKGFWEAGLIFGVGDFNEMDNLESAFHQIEKSDLLSILEKQREAGIGNAPENIRSVFKTLNHGAVIHS